jgi:branched-subunit amino acid transport protein
MTIWTVILLTGVGSFLLRLSFIAMVRGDQLPDLAQRALRLVPAAVLAALVVPAVTPSSGDWTRPVAAIAAAVVAWRSRSMLWTLIAGMGVLWLARAIF